MSYIRRPDAAPPWPSALPAPELVAARQALDDISEQVAAWIAERADPEDVLRAMGERPVGRGPVGWGDVITAGFAAGMRMRFTDGPINTMEDF